jgi:hypothetical protein
MGIKCRSSEGFFGEAASKNHWRPNDDGVQIGRVIARIAESNLVGPSMQWHLNHSAGWREEAVTIQGQLLRRITLTDTKNDR